MKWLRDSRCRVSSVAADALVHLHQGISSRNADQHFNEFSVV